MLQKPAPPRALRLSQELPRLGDDIVFGETNRVERIPRQREPVLRDQLRVAQLAERVEHFRAGG